MAAKQLVFPTVVILRDMFVRPSVRPSAETVFFRASSYRFTARVVKNFTSNLTHMRQKS